MESIRLVPRPPIDPRTVEYHMDKAMLIRDEWRASHQCMDCHAQVFNGRALCDECRAAIRVGFVRVRVERPQPIRPMIMTNPFIFRRSS